MGSAENVAAVATNPVTVRMNNFDRLWSDTGEEVLSAVRAVGESAWFILGGEVKRFESELPAIAGGSGFCGCASGLDAIEIALKACGLKAGQRVLTTPLTAFATTLAVLRAGGEPCFVDVDESGLLDLDLVADAVANRANKIEFLLPVHLYGHALDLSRLAEIAKSRNVVLIEDCAQSIGAKSNGVYTGSVGAAAAWSFYPTKNLGALGDGGAISSKDPETLSLARSIRDYGQSAKYVHDIPGMNSRLDELHAAILSRVFLPRLRSWTARRVEIALQYSSKLSNPLISIPPTPKYSESVWHLFPILVGDGRRDELLKFLRDSGVESAVHYPKIVCEQKAMMSHGKILSGKLDNATRFAREELSIPINPYLSDTEVNRVIDIINAWRPK